MFWVNECREHSCCYSDRMSSVTGKTFLLFGQHDLKMLYLKNILIWLNLYEIKCNPSALIFCLIMHISHTVFTMTKTVTSLHFPWTIWMNCWSTLLSFHTSPIPLFIPNYSFLLDLTPKHFLDLTPKHILWSCIPSPSGFQTHKTTRTTRKEAPKLSDCFFFKSKCRWIPNWWFMMVPDLIPASCFCCVRPASARILTSADWHNYYWNVHIYKPVIFFFPTMLFVSQRELTQLGFRHFYRRISYCKRQPVSVTFMHSSNLSQHNINTRRSIVSEFKNNPDTTSTLGNKNIMVSLQDTLGVLCGKKNVF